MKFCEECGAKLADDAVFCEECGAKQAPAQKETVAEPVVKAEAVVQTEPVTSEQPVAPTPKLSETCTPAKREIKGWLMTILLIICSPLVLFELIWWMPDLLFTIVFFGVQLVILVTMWRKRTWKTWLKLMWTLAYIIMLFI